MPQETARIAILCPGYGLVPRGVETFIGGMVTGLRRLKPGWTFDIYCRARSGEPEPGVRLIHVPALDRHGVAASAYAMIGHRLGSFLRTRIDAECLSFTLAAAPRVLGRRYDLIFNQAGPFAGRLCGLKRAKHGTPFVHKTASGYGELEAVMARQRPDAIVATSPYVKAWVEDACPGSVVECIPNAVDRSAFRPYSADELEACRDGLAVFRMKRPIVLFVGAMDAMKRPELLISAMSRVPDASLVMIGSGLLADYLQDLGGSELADRFLYVPQVSREQIPLYYNTCDLFTLPSEEPFGIAFLEAMACNKPVLANNSPVQEWMFGDAGATCDCTNPSEYADAIGRMLSSDYGVRPLERSRDFEWTHVVSEYAGLFDRLMS